MPDVAAVKSAQLEPMVRNSPVGAASALVGGAIMVSAVAYEDGFLSLGLALWYGLLVVTYAGQVGLAFMLRRRASPGLNTRTGLAWFTAIGLIEGVVWSSGIVGVSATRPIEQELTVLLLGAGVAAGAALSFGFHMPTFLCRFLGATVPYVLWAIFQADGLHLMLALTVFVYSVSSIQLTLGFNKSFILNTRLTLENENLVRELRVQKEAAEQANIAKSKFIATASHDLRQPVHALGLLAGALQGHAMNEEMRRLVKQIGGSVTAMDGLFNSLLDISRLDAGVVETQIEDFPIQPLLERVCRDYFAEAESKGLRLTWSRCSAVVRTDPFLLERILRNLVSNAVRYTDRGRIVAGCRRGNRLRVELWDTGRGIPLDQQREVFGEFFQLGNLERDRAKGLGLGLAIVDRLAKLLDCAVTLRSAPGKGSVFTVSIPLAERQRFGPPALQGAPIFAMPRGLILVIDDDPVIQSAMQSLLSSWEHDVIVAGSSAEMLDRVAARARRPDLIICDYRLRDGENGIGVIKRLRSNYSEYVPAILITGDTGSDRLQEAQESGLILLHKPVAEIKLRATVGNLMRARAS
ncbi:MAG: response regulator [Hyphomicrobiales bacterium]|nr:response regulator [Hyphomicrobiales bacterium]